MNRPSGDADNNNVPSKGTGSSSNKDDIVDKEVLKQIIKGHKELSKADHARLMERYKDPKLLRTIDKELYKRLEKIRKRGKELADDILKAYDSQTDGSMTREKLRDMISSFRKDNKLDDDTWREVEKQMRKRLAGYDPEPIIMNDISKALGDGSNAPDGLLIDDSDFKYVQQILDRHSESQQLSDQIVWQSTLYRDCALEAISGAYIREKHATMHHIHPLIAALFFPKIALLEHQMLLSNIGRMVHRRKDGKDYNNLPDYALGYNISHDPSDMGCSDVSPMADMAKRYEVQTKLWKAVLSLRNGIYFTDAAGDLTKALDSCKISGLDAPDLSFSQDEQAMARRLLSVFSIRPTCVNIFNNSPVDAIGSPFGRSPMIQQRQVPMIVVRLYNFTTAQVPVSVQGALQNSQTLLHNGSMVVTRTQQVTSSYETLFVAVTRRYRNTVMSQYGRSFQFMQLPIPSSGAEVLNNTPVAVQDTINLPDGTSYSLRSAVLVEETELEPGVKTIIGTSAVIAAQPVSSAGTLSPTYLYYNPQLSRFRESVTPGQNWSAGQNQPANATTPGHRNPVMIINQYPSLGGSTGFDWQTMVQQRATLLVYVRDP
jgi:hypothetical protein